ncbi:autotransporter outer membrane beta-barrel domain-containing protein [Pasteurella multocida]|uniref:autotransporter outer membrane beta-barrel domain-containing protein n=1 Tax=Pasteurella multocida TaxID=747 RepID=UPI00028285AD|nr:autotransporter outer membrane beta-barrel domain-containing protein [Pasteurella multocida]ARB73553.1 autotransporter outer membrane beta-barrel domain-containing protein [Pasteurella multocida]EJZ77670.1 autotransporter [Pasteurella multocida subsp. gallicida X73]OBP26462.1 autotransporter outer membrane beta-barrel domain-containing protein [Pasteurella multocida subsp. multocida]HDR1326562.1 autotransporter outer membrane beta-barrel domain-containing protein [Pasteurella multocida]HDR1
MTHLKKSSLPLILTSLCLSSNVWSSVNTTSCGEGCTVTEEIDTATDTHIITIDGDKTRSYSHHLAVLEDNKRYRLTNHLHLENGDYKVNAPERNNARSAEIINHGKLISSAPAGATSAIDAQWGNITEKLHVTNYGEIRTDGLGGNECAICSRYFKRAGTLAESTLKTPTEVVYEVHNLGKEAQLLANGGPSIWLDNGKFTHINNEGTILSKSKVIPSVAIRYTTHADLQNRGTIKSLGHSAVFIQNANKIDFMNSGNLESSDPTKTVVSLGGESVSLVNAGKISFSQNDPTKQSRAIGLTGSEKVELILKTGSKIDGFVATSANGKNNQLILTETGEEQGLLYGKNKFQNFHTLTMRGKKWTLSDPFIFKETIYAESGQLVLKQGSLTATNIILGEKSELMFASDYELNGKFTHQGKFTFAHHEPTPVFKNVTINEDYQGHNGTLHLSADFNGTTNPTDTLFIRGNATGKTRVAIHHIGADAENAVNGVKIIETNTSTDNAFVIDNYLSKGAFVYHLEKRHETNQDNWYLTSYIGGTPSYRAEMASYANNFYAAHQLFQLRLEDRLSRHHFLNQSADKTFWIRAVEGTNHNRMRDNQNTTKAQRYVTQLGKTVINQAHYHAGVMFGYAKQSSKTHSSRVGTSRGKVQSYALGVYGTWYQNPNDDTGLYIDSWLQYQWFKNQVINPASSNDNYRTQGLSASLELGYHLPLVQYTVADLKHSFNIQPQAQFIWQKLNSKQHREPQQTLIHYIGQQNTQTRLGVRFSLDSHFLNTQWNLKPYFEVNWLHHAKDYGITINDVVNHIEGAKQLFEYKVGIASQFGRHLRFWLDTTHQRGKQQFKDNQLNVGFNILF